MYDNNYFDEDFLFAGKEFLESDKKDNDFILESIYFEIYDSIHDKEYIFNI